MVVCSLAGTTDISSTDEYVPALILVTPPSLSFPLSPRDIKFLPFFSDVRMDLIPLAPKRGFPDPLRSQPKVLYPFASCQPLQQAMDLFPGPPREFKWSIKNSPLNSYPPLATDGPIRMLSSPLAPNADQLLVKCCYTWLSFLSRWI